MYVRNDGTFETTIVAETAGREVNAVTVDRTAGDAFVWTESDGIGGPNAALFTAPFAERSDQIARRRVTAFTDSTGYGGAYIIAAHGMAVLRSSRTTALLVRLSDGAFWILEAEPGSGIVYPIWVDDQSVWMTTGEMFPTETFQETLIRFDRAELGTPSPAL